MSVNDLPAVALGCSALGGLYHPMTEYDGIMRSAEDSLKRLGLNKVDVLYVHDIGDPGVATNTLEYMAQLTDSGHRALSQLKREGVTQEVRLGVNTVEACLNLARYFKGLFITEKPQPDGCGYTRAVVVRPGDAQRQLKARLASRQPSCKAVTTNGFRVTRE